jgi:hypothetical protein
MKIHLNNTFRKISLRNNSFKKEFDNVITIFRTNDLEIEAQNPDDEEAARKHFYRGLDPV